MSYAPRVWLILLPIATCFAPELYVWTRFDPPPSCEGKAARFVLPDHARFATGCVS